MMKYICIVVLFSLMVSFSDKKETCKTKIQFEKEFTIINSDTLFFNKSVRGVNIKTLERILNEKAIKADPYDSSHVFFYYFKKQGVKCTSSSYGASEYPSDIEINYRENINLTKKIKMYDGELKLFGVPINKNTTFNDLYRNPIIHPIIDYSYYGKDTNNLKANNITINTPFNSYIIFFNGKDGSSLIENISANF